MRTVDLYIPAETLRELGFRALGDCFQEATVRDMTMLSCDDSSSLVVNTFEELVNEELDDSDTIEWWERLTSDATTATYLYKIQQEVLETAYELGYYEIPRETTADAIAERLDLDRSTVTEHLQRTERNLIATVLSS